MISNSCQNGRFYKKKGLWRPLVTTVGATAESGNICSPDDFLERGKLKLGLIGQHCILYYGSCQSLTYRDVFIHIALLETNLKSASY